MCYYNTQTNSASAPMFGHMFGFAGIGNTLLKLIGLSGSMGSFTGFWPDLVISLNEDNVPSSQALRSTVYHEYGHSRHFFQVSQSNFLYWLYNVEETVFEGPYGTAINTSPGDFFSVTEGWADLIGNFFASKKYSTQVVREVTWNTEQTIRIYDETNTWLFHLENNPTFFNSFIPRGLFWDLMDNSGSTESFDEISGHDVEDIYELLTDDVWTIQDFREKWEIWYPDVNNNALFMRYNVELP